MVERIEVDALHFFVVSICWRINIPFVVEC